MSVSSWLNVSNSTMDLLEISVLVSSYPGSLCAVGAVSASCRTRGFQDDLEELWPWFFLAEMRADCVGFRHCLAKGVVALCVPRLYYWGLFVTDRLPSSLLIHSSWQSPRSGCDFAQTWSSGISPPPWIMIICLIQRFVWPIPQLFCQDWLRPRWCRVWWICLDPMSSWSSHAP